TYLHLPELFAQHGADFGANLLSDAGTAKIIAKRVVDEGLIVTAMGLANLVPEVIDDIPVQPDRDADLLWRQRNDCLASSLAQVVLALHIFLSSYWARSREVASRAEIIRMVFPRSA